MRYGQRRYPRLVTDQPGEIEVRVREKGRSRRVRIPCAVRSLAPEGAGLSVDALRNDSRKLPLTRGSSITLHFVADGQGFDLPGSVAWYHDPAANEAAPMDMGVRLHLEMAGLQTRQAYAMWIVRRLEAAQSAGG